MTHSFDTRVAEITGSIEKAILLQNLSYWISHNKANNKNKHDGLYYSYNTYDAFKELFPYIKLNTIKRVLRELEADGYIVSRNDLNTNSYDKTKWYSMPKSELSPLLFDSYKNNHRESEKPPSSLTDIKPNIQESLLSSFREDPLNKEIKVSDETILDFIKYRKDIKKPIKTIAPIKLYIKALHKCIKNEYTKEEVIELMRGKEWASLNPEWVEKELGKRKYS